MNTPQTIIMFDLDGTLFDTAQAIPLTFNAAFRALDLKELPQALIRQTIGLPLEQAFAQLMQLPVNNYLVELAVEEYQRQFKLIIIPAAQSLLFPGVINGLETLKRLGMRLSVTTNKFSHSANTLLSAAHIASLFDIVVCADEVQQKKPHPESGEKILDFFNASNAQAIMVGDTTHDILMANHLGCKSIAVTYGIHDEKTLLTASPNSLAHDFTQVVQLCQKYHQQQNALVSLV